MKTTIAVVGFGDRSEQYTKYVLKHPEEGEVTAVVDPNPARRGYAQRLFGLPEARCFSDFDSFIAAGQTRRLRDQRHHGQAARLDFPATPAAGVRPAAGKTGHER